MYLESDILYIHVGGGQHTSAKRSAVAEFSMQGSKANNRQAHQASHNKMTPNVE
jgi:hypothetical protein